jgi:hypothetical protein
MSSKASAASKQAMAILDDLKVGITEMVEQYKESGIPLNENASVSRVCYIVERILQIGLKDIAIFGTTTVWDYLEEIRECLPGAEKLVDRIKSIQKTDMGRARAFIRIGLNDQMLGQSLEALVWNRELTAKYYTKESILTSEEYASIMFLLFENIKNVQLSIRVDDPLLGHLHFWDLMARATVPLSPVKKAGLPLSSNSPAAKATGSSSTPTTPSQTIELPSNGQVKVEINEILSLSPSAAGSSRHQSPVSESPRIMTPPPSVGNPFDPDPIATAILPISLIPVPVLESTITNQPAQIVPDPSLDIVSTNISTSPTKEVAFDENSHLSSLSIVVEAPSSPQDSKPYSGVNVALLRPDSPTPTPLPFGMATTNDSDPESEGTRSGSIRVGSMELSGMYESEGRGQERQEGQRPSIGHSPVKIPEKPLQGILVQELPRIDLNATEEEVVPKYLEEDQIEKSLLHAPFENEFHSLAESPNPNYGRVLYTPPGSGRLPATPPAVSAKPVRIGAISQGSEILGTTPSQSDLPHVFSALMLQSDVSDLHKCLLNNLRLCIAQLHSHGAQQTITWKSHFAPALMDAIEAILLDAFPQAASWDAAYTTLWNWLSNVSPSMPHVTHILNPLAQLAQLSHISQISRSRAFIGAAINRKCLDSILSSLVKDSRLQFESRSLLANEALSLVFFKLIQELKQFHFDLSENPLDPLLAPSQIVKNLPEAPVASHSQQPSHDSTEFSSTPSKAVTCDSAVSGSSDEVSVIGSLPDVSGSSVEAKPPSFKKRKKLVTIQDAPPTPQGKKAESSRDKEVGALQPADSVPPISLPTQKTTGSSSIPSTQQSPEQAALAPRSSFAAATLDDASTAVVRGPSSPIDMPTKEEAEMLLNAAVTAAAGSGGSAPKSGPFSRAAGGGGSEWRTVFKASEAPAASPPTMKDAMSRSPKGSASLKLPLSSSPLRSPPAHSNAFPTSSTMIGFGHSKCLEEVQSQEIASSSSSQFAPISSATQASSSQDEEAASGKRNRSFSGNAPTWAREIQQFPVGSYKPNTNWLGGLSDDEPVMQDWDDSIASSPPAQVRATIGTYSASSSLSTSPPSNLPREPLPYRLLSANIIAEYQPSTKRSIIRKEASPSNKGDDGGDETSVLKLKQLEGEEAVEVDSQLYKNSKPAEFFILELVSKPELTSKNSNCSGCGDDLTKDTARFCAYSSNFYCPNCHSNKKSILPARVIKQWNFKAAKVSDYAYTYLQTNWSRPVLDVTSLIEQAKQAGERSLSLPLMLPVRLPIKLPLLPRSKHSSVTIIVTLTALRERLTTAAEFIRSCRTGQRLLGTLIDRLHLLWSSTLWSMQDLVEADSGKLEPLLKKTIDLFSRHVRHCDSCSGKGFVCEICTSREVIYPFDPQTVSCPNCKALFHETCWRSNPGKCPKCVRVKSIRGKDKLI